MVMSPYYDLGWTDDEEESEDEWVQGYSVPARLEFLLPVINFVHLSVLWTKFGIQHYGAMIPRKVFLFYPNHLLEDYTPDEIFLDDEEQDTLTRRLQKEDILRNESYAKIFAFLVITPLPLFCMRLYLRVTLLDIMCMVSLIISAAGIPTVRTDSFAVVLPGPWKIFFIRINIYIAAVVALHVTFWPPGDSWDFNGGEVLWMDDLKHFGLLPLIMALISHCARRFMEAINMMELEHIRYSYLPQSRGGISDMELIPRNPEIPGPG